MGKIIVTVDLGHFKAFKSAKDPLNRESLTLIESYDSIEGHGKLSDQLSDSAGRFMKGSRKGEATRGSGEPGNLEADINRKIIKIIAKNISDLITREKKPVWYLAAPVKVNNQIIKLLSPDVRARLDRNIVADLIKVDKSEILNHFK